VIIHAAALKHLSALEQQPREAFLTNVLGTQNVVEAANSAQVNTFVNISTDKAADPSSVLGKSKRIAEEIINSRSTSTQKLSVRFGNVFASKGSVIETFVYQLIQNLPVTLTDQNVERYFMSTMDAANLVLEAVTLRESGIFVLDMGLPVKMKDVIESLAEYLKVEANIQITGLRPGEKISEIVYGNNEGLEVTGLDGISRITKNKDLLNQANNSGYGRFFTATDIQSHEDAKKFFLGFSES
jgi:FlaA1/EpsC-like NDP-sugar epimerase